MPFLDDDITLTREDLDVWHGVVLVPLVLLVLLDLLVGGVDAQLWSRLLWLLPLHGRQQSQSVGGGGDKGGVGVTDSVPGREERGLRHVTPTVTDAQGRARTSFHARNKFAKYTPSVTRSDDRIHASAWKKAPTLLFYLCALSLSLFFAEFMNWKRFSTRVNINCAGYNFLTMFFFFLFEATGAFVRSFRRLSTLYK